MRDLAERALGANHVWVSLFLGVCMQLLRRHPLLSHSVRVTLKEVAGWNSDESLGVAETVGTMGINIAFHNGFLVDRLGSRPMSGCCARALLQVALARERRVLGEDRRVRLHLPSGSLGREASPRSCVHWTRTWETSARRTGARRTACC